MVNGDGCDGVKVVEDGKGVDGDGKGGGNVVSSLHP